MDAVLVDDVEDCDTHETGRSGGALVEGTGEGIGGSTGSCWVLERACPPRFGIVWAREVVAGTGGTVDLRRLELSG